MHNKGNIILHGAPGYFSVNLKQYVNNPLIEPGVLIGRTLPTLNPHPSVLLVNLL